MISGMAGEVNADPALSGIVKISAFDAGPGQATGPAATVTFFDAHFPFTLRQLFTLDEAEPFGLAIAQSVSQAQVPPLLDV